jgi:DNA mismatch endonuclease, patch repair protein
MRLGMEMNKYIRDKRSPVPQSEARSEIMSSIKAKNTKPEILVRRVLWNNGIKGYRLHWKKAPGRPDISFPGRKIAIFVNGCFWHRCPYCKPTIPKSNSVFWNEKFEKNVERDNKKISELEKGGWKVVIVWECEIGQVRMDYLDRIKKLL